MTAKPKILFVDDERQILVSLRALFRSEYQVYLANNAKEALEIIKREQILAIISDQQMPGVFGHELLRRVRKISPNTMRLLLTGYSDLGAIMNSINDGEIFRFIHKPWNNAELRAVVRSAVNIAQNTQGSTYRYGYDLDDPVGGELSTAAPIDPEPLAPIDIDDTAAAVLQRPRQPAAAPVHRPTAATGRPVSASASASASTQGPAPVQRTTSAHKPPPAAAKADGPTVLVLDDMLETYNRLRDLFQHQHPVRLAHTVDKAIDVLDQEEVALLVTDVNINGEDTTDFIKVLKQQYPLILTLVVTDAADSDLAIELINQGRIFRYLRKPAGDGTLKLSINQGLRFYQANKRNPDLLRQQQTEEPTLQRSPSFAERLSTRLRALKQRFSFGF